MKREVFVLVVALLALPLAIAPTPPAPEVHVVRPTITIEFDEAIMVRHAEFLFEEIGTNLSAATTMVNASTARFTPDRSLANGNYTLRADVEDLVGNPYRYTERFQVVVPMTDIILVQPRLGHARQSPFDLRIQTMFQGAPSQTRCKYSIGINPLYNFDSPILQGFDALGPAAEHSKAGFTGPQPNFILPVDWYVICLDTNERLTQQRFDLFVDTIPPTIETVVLNPARITERSEGGVFATILSVKASEPVICKYSLASADYATMVQFTNYDVQDAGAFKSETNTTVADFDPTRNTAEYTLAVGCEDRSGQQTQIETRQIRVDTTEALTIEVLNPPAFPTESTVMMELRTNKNAHCLYAAGSAQPSTPFSPGAAQSAAHFHTALLGRLDEGDHSYHVLCSSTAGGTQQIAEQTVQFTIDRTSPSRPVVEGSGLTCQQGGFVFEAPIRFSANDSASGVSHYLWTLKAGNEVLINWTRSAGTVSSITTRDNGQPLNLSSRQSYTLQVTAVDNAGKESSAASHTLRYDPTRPVCLERNPPQVTLLKSATTAGINVTVQCQDDTGCDPSRYLYDTDAQQASCHPGQRLFAPFSTTLYETAYFCYNVSDLNGNTAAGGEMITAGFLNNTNLSSTCSNFRKDADETDVDCGGSCLPCQDRKQCQEDADCLSSYCTPDAVCGRASCDDTIQNGDENGVDCGGNCLTGCPEGTTCTFNNECETNYCDPASRSCAAASCDDGVKNGQETGTDCGGGCGGCAEGEICRADADCTSNRCSFGFCTGGTGDSDSDTGTVDTDGDGIPDDEELRLGLNPNDPSDGEQDPDNDGLTNFQEFQYRTDINNPDTDGDGYSDGEEINAGTDPLDPTSKPEGTKLFSWIFLILGLLLFFGGLFLLAYNRYVLVPQKRTAIAKPLPAFRSAAPSQSQIALQRRMSLEREQRLQTMRDRLAKEKAKRTEERSKLFSLFGGKAEPEKIPVPPAAKEAKAAQPIAEERRSGWLWLGKQEPKPTPVDKGEDTFAALERLTKGAPQKPKGDALRELRSFAEKPKKKKRR